MISCAPKPLDEEGKPYQLPVEKTEVEVEEDSDLVKKVMADLEHYNEYVGLLKQRDDLYTEQARELCKELGEIPEEEEKED